MAKTLINKKPNSSFLNWRKATTRALISLLLFFSLLQANAQADITKGVLDIDVVIDHIEDFQKASERLEEIDRIISTLDSSTDMEVRIELDLRRLVTLTDIGDTQNSTLFASKMHAKYTRSEFESDKLYADTMTKIIQAFAKTRNISSSYDIIQDMNEAFHHNPDPYLNYKIDKSLVEIYVESFNYQRALDVVLSMIDNKDYQSLPGYQKWKESLLNEAAFLYNRMGNAPKALEYLEYAKIEYESKEQRPRRLIKKVALNKGNRGRAYLLLGNYAAAKEMGYAVLEAGETLEQNYVIALGYRLIGSASYNLGEYDQALETLEAGIALADAKDIASMQTYLYKDYSSTLKQLGLYEKALTWNEKLTDLEIKARQAAAATSSELHAAEDRARQSYMEVEQLKLENNAQREISIRDRRNAKVLKFAMGLLLALVSVLAFLTYFLHRNQNRLIASEKRAQLATEKAQTANRAKSEFLANMSHEIRTPMNGVLGMLDILRRTPLNAQQMHYTDIIDKSGHNLLAIITDILDLSKIEAGKISLNPEACNVENVIRDVVNLFSASATEKGLKLNYEYAADLPNYFAADVLRIRQIISNLIGNAIKFTPEGHITVSVTGDVNGEHTHLKVSVKDTGIGIEQDKLSLIFEEFTQAEGSTTRRFGGTGLGLTISRKLANVMNGELSAVSTFGEGTTFTFEVPLKRVEPPVSVKTVSRSNAERPTSRTVPKASPQPKASTSTSPFKLDVLVVEDDEINRAVIATYLKHPQVHVTFAENGLEAVKAYKAKKFNVIFMDVSMPVMDGVTATTTIRDYEKATGTPRTPIICLSARVMEGDRQRFLESGMDDYLSKPVNRNELLKITSKWLKSAQTAGSSHQRQARAVNS